MEEPNKSIPDIFQQRLQHASVPPPPFVWPAVEAALQARRRRRILWLFVAGMAAVSALGVLLLRSNQGVTGLQKEQVEASKSQQNTAYPLSVPKQAESGNQPESAVPQDAKSSSQVPEVSGISSTPTTEISSHKGDVEQVFNRSKTAKYENQQAPIQTIAQDYLTAESAENTTVAEHQNWSTKSLPVPSNAPVSSARKHTQTEIKSLKTSEIAVGKKQTPRFCYDFSRHPSAWLWDVYVGPSLAQGSLTSAIEDEPYLQQRLATESRSVAMQAGLRASWMFNRNFLIRSGVHYEQFTEVFEYIDPTSVVTSVNNVYVNGQFVGTDTVVTYGKNYQKTYNRYGLLDIPFMLGVEMRSGRTGFNINAGISANVLFFKSGSIINPQTEEPMRFGGENPFTREVFRPVVGLSTLASVQWYWHIDARHRLFVEPSFRQIMRPITSDRHPVSQRYSILGIRFGATKIF